MRVKSYINTGICSKHAYEIINKMISRTRGYFRRNVRNSIDIINIEFSSANEVIIGIGVKTDYAFYGSDWSKFNEKQCKVKFANMLKIMLAKLVYYSDVKEDDAEWSKSNKRFVTINDCNFTIAELHLIYDMLKGKKNLEKKYDSETYNNIHGEKLDPILASLEEARRAEIIKAKEDAQNEKNAIYNKYEDLKKKLEEDKYREYADVSSNLESKIEEINKKFDYHEAA